MVYIVGAVQVLVLLLMDAKERDESFEMDLGSGNITKAGLPREYLDQATKVRAKTHLS